MQHPAQHAGHSLSPQGGAGSASLAALTLLLVAYTNFSLAGLLFLLAFLTWGASRTQPEQQRAKRLWAAVSGLSALGLLLQLGVQAAFLLRAPGLGAIVPALRVIGFPRAENLADALLAVVPLLLALLASAAQVQAARDSDSQQQRRHSEGTELQPLASEQQLWQRQQLRASRLASSSLASIAVAMALMAAAIAQPSVLAAPYMLSAAVAVWRWSGASSRLSHGSSRGGNGRRALLQTYTAAYLVALYAWQAVLHGWDVLQPIAAVLGLFTLSSESDEKGWNGLVPALVQLAALLLLYLALGAEQPRARHLGHGQAFGSEGGRDERSPLLSGRQQPQASQLAAEPVAATSWVQLLYLLLLEAVELVCSRPAAVAAVLAAVSLLRPSLLGGCVLLIGLVSLMGGWADAALRRMRRPLAALLLVWQLACYGATVAGRVVDVPQAADAVGVHDFGSSAWLPLLAMLLAAAATAGPATPARAGGSPLSSSNLLRLQQQQQQQQQGVSPRLQSLLFRIGSLRQPHAGTGAHSAGSPSDPGSPAAAAGAAASDGTLDAAAAAPWLVAWNLLLRLLYFCGILAVPAALFVVGCTRYDALHGIYLAGLLCWLAGNTLHLKPGLAAAVFNGSSHWMLRSYCSMHMAALYVAYVGGLQGFGSLLQPKEWQALLTAIGVWQPAAAATMLPVLALLLLATLHAHVAEAVHSAAREQYCSSVEGVSTWHPQLVVHASRLAVSYGPAAIVALGYCLLLVDCDIALLGLGYLLLLAALLLHQPPHSRWQEAGGPTSEAADVCDAPLSPRSMGSGVLPTVMLGVTRHVPGVHKVWLASSAARWLPLSLVAAYAACDFVVQAALPAVAAASAAGLPTPSDGVLDFIKNVVGLPYDSHGTQLALRLLRPLLVLAGISVYRCCYSLGTLHRQLQHRAMSQAVLAARRLHSQLGWKALGKRLVILHGSKAVALCAFAAAMQFPGAVGWLLTAGTVTLAPLLGAPRPGATSKQGLLRAALRGASTVAGLWMVSQYALCVPWLQHWLSKVSPSALEWAQWAGLRLPPTDGAGASDSGTADLESLLRAKCLLLVAVALRMRAFRWQSKLPAELRAAGKCGSPCSLFWPQSPGYVPPPLGSAHGAGSSSLPQLGAMSLLGALHRAGALLLDRAQHTTQQALRAIDWPAGHAMREAGGGEEAPAELAAGQPRPDSDHLPPSPVASGRLTGADVYTRREQLRLLRFAAQDWFERAWQDWNLDVCMLLLLLAAFAAANALSLMYMLSMAAGMALSNRTQQCVWRWVVLPLLALLLLFQYLVLMGPPPAWLLGWLLPVAGNGAASLPGLAPDVEIWLGLDGVDSAALWLLYISFGACVLHTHYASWERCAAQHTRRSGVSCEPHLQSQLARGGSFDGIESPPSQASAPLLSAADRSSRSGAVQQLPAGHTTLQVTVFSPELQAGVAAVEDEDALPLWQPLTLEAQRQWSWHDWGRYLICRHYLDFLLVCVVALCTLENDMLHAGYLALALAFFRSRIALRIKRNSLFWWLPLFNFAVMLLTLVYQAPFQLLLPPPRHPDEGSKACSWAHILGLFRLDPGESLLSLGYRGAMADVMLWVLIRLQSHIFASTTYDRVIAVVRQEEQEEKVQLEQHVADWKQKQAAAAVEESRLRAARRQRVERLKAAAAGSFAAGVDTVQQLYAFLVPKHRQQPAAPHAQVQVQEEAKETQQAADRAAAVTGAPSAAAQETELQAPQAESEPTGAPLGSQPPHVPSSTGLTEYEREMLAADAASEQARHQERRESPAAADARSNTEPGVADAAAAAVDAAAEQGRQVGGRLRAWLRHNVRRSDRNSYVCYLLFCVAFLADCSLLTLAFPLSAFSYALVSIKPSGAYWQAVLVYSEALIVAAYALRVPEQLGCDFISPSIQASADVLGVHGSNPLRALPIFLVYLATLKHHYSLATRYAARQAAAAAAGGGMEGVLDLETGTSSARPASGGLRRGSSGQYLGETLGSTVSNSLQRIGLGLLEGSTTAWEFLLRCCTVAERPPHFIMVEVGAPSSGAAASGDAGSQEERLRGQQLQEQLQQILDGCRRTDIAAARERQERQRMQTFAFGGTTEQGGSSSRASAYEAPLTFETGAASGPQQGGAAGSVGPMLPAQQGLRLAQSSGHLSEPAGGGIGRLHSPDLSTVGPLQLSFVSFVASPAGGLEVAPQPAPTPSVQAGSSSGDGGSHVGKVDGNGGGSSSAATTTALFEVAALRSTPENSSGWCSVAGWPLRSLNPARHAAATLLRFQETARGQPLVPQQSGQAAHLQVLSAEYHSRQPQDWYAATTALDFVAWCYVALQYNAVVTSARSLSEITSEHVVPLDYLVTILVLFLLMVADRIFYTVGSPLGKALLHLGEMTMYFWYCLVLFWSPLTSAGARTHLRILLLLKCGAFALGALQLRSGYPPRADSSNGMGRHTFWFMRRVNTARAVAFNVFLALPFVYELRQLLDWALTPTTLTLFDWLKLEEINVSLFFVTWNRKLRANKPFGARQPRYTKFLQGLLLFSGLLLLLFLPLLLFSSGAPTYTVPTVVSFNANATLSTSDASGAPTAHHSRHPQRRRHLQAVTAAGLPASVAAGVAPAAAAEFPLFGGGRRRQRQQWLPDATPMPTELAAYSPQQFQLLCTSADADQYWDITPPAQRELLDALLSGEEGGEDAGPGVSLSLGWRVERDLPPPSDHGGPVCHGSLSVPLSAASRSQLAAVLNGSAASAQLLRPDPADNAGGSNKGSSGNNSDLVALYPLVWLMRGDVCSSKPLRQGGIGGGGSSSGGDTGSLSWSELWVACNASLLPAPEMLWPVQPELSLAEGQGQGQVSVGGNLQGWPRQLRGGASPGGGERGTGSEAVWWRMDCWSVNASGAALPSEAGGQEGQCGAAFAGPRLVTVLERVQGGLIGQTLSKYGIAGLYTIVVLSVGRFLRLSLSNMRARIPFEDLPNTRRLVGLCQDLYIARAEGELGLEEQLYWSLINVYRLPSVMFEMTRKRQ